MGQRVLLISSPTHLWSAPKIYSWSLSIETGLDYCNSSYSGLNHLAISHQLLISYSAARQTADHIPPIFASLYWLLVEYRIDFKILNLVIIIIFRALPVLAPSGIKDLLTPYAPSHCLCSSSNTLPFAPTARLVSKSVSVRAPRFWLSVPEDHRSADSVMLWLLSVIQ